MKNYFIFKRRRNLLFILVIIILCGVAGYFFYRFQAAERQIKKIVSEKNSVQTTIDKVSQLIELPKNEVPTVANITDKNKLQNQRFFSNAKNGDQVLIYFKAKKAIIYRPSINKIIEAGPFNPISSVVTITPKNSTESSKMEITTPTPTVKNLVSDAVLSQRFKLVIYNGSKIPGLAKLTANEIKEKYINVDVVKIDDAIKNYQQTLVIDLKGNKKSLVESLTEFTNGIKGELPAEEKKPEADILIILGR